MSKRLILYAVVLLVLVSLVVFGLSQWRQLDNLKTMFGMNVTDPSQLQVNMPAPKTGSTMTKQVFKQKSIVQYTFQGTLSGNFIKAGNLFITDFTFKNDPLKRPIKVHLGYMDGSGVFLGRYQGSWSGDSNWVLESWEGFPSLIGIEREVMLFSEFILLPPDYSEDIYEEVKILDKLLERETQGTLQDAEIPTNFALAAYQIGIVVPNGEAN